MVLLGTVCGGFRGEGVRNFTEVGKRLVANKIIFNTLSPDAHVGIQTQKPFRPVLSDSGYFWLFLVYFKLFKHCHTNYITTTRQQTDHYTNHHGMYPPPDTTHDKRPSHRRYKRKPTIRRVKDDKTIMRESHERADQRPNVATLFKGRPRPPPNRKVSCAERR